METSKVLAIMGSMSDDEQMAKCIKTLQEAGVNFEHMVISGHRTPELLQEVIQNTDADVIITAAGMSAHLAGISASHTIKPVIGIPLKSSADIDGRGALFSIVNMPPGIPVATVAIDGGKNAAILAIQMLAIKDETLRAWLLAERTKMENKIKSDNLELKARYSDT
jgi:5-(carboxyamino)imidazole ribonucleotide mutase